jgi:hypothetical protein
VTALEHINQQSINRSVEEQDLGGERLNQLPDEPTNRESMELSGTIVSSDTVPSERYVKQD